MFKIIEKKSKNGKTCKLLYVADSNGKFVYLCLIDKYNRNAVKVLGDMVDGVQK